MAKIVVLGGTKSGKTCLIKKLSEQELPKHYIPSDGISFESWQHRSILTDCHNIEYWEVSESYPKLISENLQSAHVVLLCLPVDKPDELKALGKTLETLAPLPDRIGPKYLLVPTQTDKGVTIDPLALKAFCTEYERFFHFGDTKDTDKKIVECSARDNTNIDALRRKIVRLIEQVENQIKLRLKSTLPSRWQTKESRYQKRINAAEQECRGLWDPSKDNIDNIRHILNDYAQENNKLYLFFSLHGDRNHTQQVAKIVNVIDTNPRLTCEDIIKALDMIKLRNTSGALSLRLTYIKQQLKMEESDKNLHVFSPSPRSWLPSICQF